MSDIRHVRKWIPPLPPPSSLLIFLSTPLPCLDEGVRFAAVIDLDVDLGIFVLLISQALEVAAVEQQVEGKAESQHAQH